MMDNPFIVTGEPMSAQDILEKIKSTKEAMIKRLEEQGLPPVETPPLFAPPEVWEARQKALDAGDFEKVVQIETIILWANGYLYESPI